MGGISQPPAFHDWGDIETLFLGEPILSLTCKLLRGTELAAMSSLANFRNLPFYQSPRSQKRFYIPRSVNSNPHNAPLSARSRGSPIDFISIEFQTAGKELSSGYTSGNFKIHSESFPTFTLSHTA